MRRVAVAAELLVVVVVQFFFLFFPWPHCCHSSLPPPSEKINMEDKEYRVCDQNSISCSECWKRVWTNLVCCTQCKHWTHKRCGETTARLTGNISFICERYTEAITCYKITGNRFSQMLKWLLSPGRWNQQGRWVLSKYGSQSKKRLEKLKKLLLLLLVTKIFFPQMEGEDCMKVVRCEA